MAFYNLPPLLSTIIDGIDKRLRRLETAIRFSAPSVDTEPAHPTTADIIYNNVASYLEYWNGTEWVIIGDNNVGSPKIPFTSTWSGTGLVKTGTPATGYYIKIGKSIFFTIQVLCTTVTNFGTGQYSLTLPFAPDGHYLITNAGIHDTSTGNHYQFAGDLNAASTTMKLYYLSNNGRNLPMDGGQPLNLATADYFYISGTYFVP